ncbi:hypothetical protein [Acidobacterium sp. S8]|uniref:hypothetical protein n=1 Tax=Acidobacterium sp. S8 TaxID=1641854 RepID=UPI00131E206F|nr:hypothetical protein [Acidobacterium sp. S8]
MSVWNWIQLAVAIIVAIVAYLGKGWSKWLGYAMVFGAGALIIGVSIVQQDYRFIGFGILAIIMVPLGLIANATAESKADDDTLGGEISNLPPWVMWVAAVLFVGAIIPFFVLKAPPNLSGGVPQTQQTELQTKHANPKPAKAPAKH